ncbi:uncharacterized protein BO97DRAFT_412587 [Aspergillus homomorphus CBS 101889]|uniref:BZIP domain-containing protein n=1 Tax=Aspergillus homomorphus (strain CBS 101889) TaxID=1450537 RepID=A0A395I2G6_ASPHC|nr:hypothetical protein BO97DRAFT_412587 [Aspergillus homomorphus CBS 101889]RAL14250.1 hypothetical protein BO97DRAFT_412587 [Aspergillus homomorphus CBS 101889]
MDTGVDYQTRRRLQNRIALQKFQSCTQIALPSSSSMSLGNQILPGRPLDQEISPGWRAPQQHVDLSGTSNNAITRLHSPAVSDKCNSSDLQGIGGALEFDLNLEQLTTPSIVQRHQSHEGLGAVDVVTSTSQQTQELLLDDSPNTIFRDIQYTAKARIFNDAILVLQKQKVNLGRQAEELIRRLISIYDLGTQQSSEHDHINVKILKIVFSYGHYLLSATYPFQVPEISLHRKRLRKYKGKVGCLYYLGDLAARGCPKWANSDKGPPRGTRPTAQRENHQCTIQASTTTPIDEMSSLPWNR